MTRPRLLDLFCAAGGASVGYSRAGFEVVGVDLEPQPRYPCEFHQGDAIEFVKEYGREFDAIAASPPCFAHSALAAVLPVGHGHVDLIPETREALVASGLPYVIENVPGAPLLDPAMLCGSMFGLGSGDRQLRRHRLFESNIALVAPGPCRHVGKAVGVYGGGPASQRPDATRRGAYQGTMAERREAMGIDWMTRDSMNLAIPPVYAEHLGAQLLAHLAAERAA